MTVSRRSLLRGGLVLGSAITVAPGKTHAATLFGDGKSDDWPALQALIDGKPVLLANDSVVVQRGRGEIVLNGGPYALSRPLELHGSGVSIGSAQFIREQAGPASEGHATIGLDSSRISPEQYGAAGDGIADDSDAIAAALSAASRETQCIYLAAGRTYCCRGFTIPPRLSLIFEPNAQLKPLRPNEKITVDGQILSVGIGQLFLPGWIFGKTNIEDGHEAVPLEWFGGRASWHDRPDCLPAFNYAIAFCRATRTRAILLGTGGYFVSGTIKIDSAIGIKGKGLQSTFLMADSFTDTMAAIELSGTQALNITDVTFSNFTLMSTKPGTGTGIKSTWFAQVNATGLGFRNFETGLNLHDASYSWKIEDSTFLDNVNHLTFGPNSNNVLISHCQLLHGKTGLAIVGSSNSISINNETNFEAIEEHPICWGGAETVVIKLSVQDSRFEKCIGPIGQRFGTGRILMFSFNRNYVENSAGSTDEFFFLPECDNVTISQSYFERSARGLLNAPPSVSRLTVYDNVLIRIPQINSASKLGSLTPAEGYRHCRAYNCSGVKGSVEV